MYINDLPICVSNAKVIAQNVIVQKLNKDLEHVRKWLMKNKLSLNVNKTEFMVISACS